MMMLLRRPLSVLLVLVAAATVSVPALASDASKQYTKALQLYDEKEYAVALPLFREALGSSDSPNARLYVARCLRETGQPAAAYNEMIRTLRAAEASSDEKYKPTATAARKELAALKEQVGLITIEIDPPADGVQVEVAGAALDAEQLQEPYAVPPGEAVTVSAAADGYAAGERSVRLTKGEQQQVSLSLDADAAGDPQPSPANDGLRIAGFVTLGAGAAVGLGLFGAGYALAKKEFDTLDRECGGMRCTDPTFADNVDRGEAMQTMAFVGLALGGAAVAAAIPMIIVGGGSDSEPASSVTLMPTVSPQGGSLTCRLHF